MSAIEYIANRLDGKPTVALSLAGAESPLHHQVRVRSSVRRHPELERGSDTDADYTLKGELDFDGVHSHPVDQLLK